MDLLKKLLGFFLAIVEKYTEGKIKAKIEQEEAEERAKEAEFLDDFFKDVEEFDETQLRDANRALLAELQRHTNGGGSTSGS